MTRHLLASVHGENNLQYGDWLVLTRAVGRDPNDHHGEAFRRLPNTKIVRINHGYHPHGTLPLPQYYEDFSTRVANYVEASPGCSRWIIGNEPNHEQERPQGQLITPAQYAECYALCRQKIRNLKFHSGDQALIGAVAPWNNTTDYPGNPTGSWIQYLEDIQHELTSAGCDGFAIHSYAREQSPASITDDTKMSAPFNDCFWDFRHYLNWMAAILPRFQGLPVYMTEFCVAGKAWKDLNTGVIQAAYDEIDAWNEAHLDRPILAGPTVYRWQYDQWEIADKPFVQLDFERAADKGYSFPRADPPDPPEETDMLQNPSFENGWREVGSDKIVLPAHWWAEYLEGGDPWYRPEIKPNQEFVTDGSLSIRAFQPEHSQGFFGIWQEVDAEPGQWYKFSVDVRVESKPPGELAAFVGIQPWGAGIFERHMIWGKETQTQIEWQRVEVIAQAFGSKVRVAMGATSKWATRNNTTWWDNAHMELFECEEGTEPPDPPDPPVGDVDYDLIRQIVREELDKTVWASGAP